MNDVNLYLLHVQKHLHLDKKIKKRIMEDLRAEMEYAIENGEASEDIVQRMGAPKSVALEYNEFYKHDAVYQARRKCVISRRIAAVSFIFTVLILLLTFVGENLYWNSDFVTKIGGMSGPSNVVMTSRMLTPLDFILRVKSIVPILLAVLVFSTIYYFIQKYKGVE